MNINELLQQKGVLISDGAMGTELAKRGMKAGECSELWNIENPDKVLDVYKSYINAGSDIILTNTFGGSRLKLKKSGLEDMVKELNSEGVKMAKKAAEGTDTLIFGSVGPTGELMEPFGEVTEKEIYDVFSEQIDAIVFAGADGIVIETMMSIEEAAAALKAAKKITDVPVVVSMTYSHSDSGFATMMGVKPAQAVQQLTKHSVNIIGANCGLGSKVMVELAKELRRLTILPIWIKPNAGLPELVDGKTVYRETSEDLFQSISQIIEIGADIVGGCCGSTPEYIRLLAELRNKKKS